MMKITLRLITGEMFEHSLEETSFTVGRSNRCAIVIPHEGVSRQHIQIDVINGDLFVTDLGSTNGVQIDGEKIPANEKVMFQTFRELSFGAVQSFQIVFESSDASRVMNNPLSKYTAPAPEREASGMTSVTTVQPFPLKKPSPSAKGKGPPPKKNKKEEQSKFSSVVLNIIVILFLIGVTWYFYNRGPAQDDTMIIKKKKEEKKSGTSDYI